MHWLSAIAITNLFDLDLHNLRGVNTNSVKGRGRPDLKKVGLAKNRGRDLVRKGYLIEL